MQDPFAGLDPIGAKPNPLPQKSNSYNTTPQPPIFHNNSLNPSSNICTSKPVSSPFDTFNSFNNGALPPAPMNQAIPNYATAGGNNNYNAMGMNYNNSMMNNNMQTINAMSNGLNGNNFNANMQSMANGMNNMNMNSNCMPMNNTQNNHPQLGNTMQSSNVYSTTSCVPNSNLASDTMNPFQNDDPFGTTQSKPQMNINTNISSPFSTTSNAGGLPSPTVVDFDPFSPSGDSGNDAFFPSSASTSNNSAQEPAVQKKRTTQAEQRAKLSINANAFQAQPPSGISPRSSTVTDDADISFDDFFEKPSKAQNEEKPVNTKEFAVEEEDEYFDSNIMNPDDEDEDFDTAGAWPESPVSKTKKSGKYEVNADEYESTFEHGRKLGVLMERVDQWEKDKRTRTECAIVKLVVENGAADQAGVTVGSVVTGINMRDVSKKSYAEVLNLIKSAPRPLTIRLKRSQENQPESWQGHVLTRVSNGTFSIGNLTSGNAKWLPKYFAFGGVAMDVLQLFISRAAYHECVIALYEKRRIHTQIQSFRLCRDHKISPIKAKVYKGYGNLHYFALSVPSLHFIAAKFASDDYETIKNLWNHTYEAIEKKKRPF